MSTPPAPNLVDCLTAAEWTPVLVEAQPLSIDTKGNLVIVLDNVLTRDECEKLIAFSEASAKGYEAALTHVGYGVQQLRPEIRHSDRCILNDTATATTLWHRIKDHLPATFGNRTLVGINECLRFLRYGVGHHFSPHYDGCYNRGDGEYSVLTVQFYLNSIEAGGETGMWIGEGEMHVVPKPGRVLIFQHRVFHSGEPVQAGIKYAIRSDIMSRPTSTHVEVPTSTLDASTSEEHAAASAELPSSHVAE
ncbi:hypothetical protein SDRG_08598 [Saprolegnia diclina VS20]|uniref:Fe2OG dioxygenase domain-containing protein n=1 Tax=Saprolegnia diclina (strain VS20) TaxID=1156394 RepID=T0RNH6_SAPDV|nr:hypothetical protein SDRG_08598 [Saprolegnia diclina VS20]EQC33918.1 hypothetical protein SDRG_08598 [Saprolegnia diclina VS20]|eukprot:XP_008612713.1 hypothetical protein SDRG_08598 [Saprolegnia diclina VS20]